MLQYNFGSEVFTLFENCLIVVLEANFLSFKNYDFIPKKLVATLHFLQNILEIALRFKN